MEPVPFHCPMQISRTSFYFKLIMMLNVLVIMLCLSSFILCIRCLLMAQVLKEETEEFFARTYRWTLTWREKMHFLDFWYVLICSNDLLIITGSVIKGLIETRPTV